MKEQEIRPKNLFEKYLELSEKDTKSFDKTQLISTNCVVCNSKNTNPFIKKNDFVIITAGLPFGNAGMTNMIRLYKVGT